MVDSVGGVSSSSWQPPDQDPNETHGMNQNSDSNAATPPASGDADGSNPASSGTQDDGTSSGTEADASQSAQPTDSGQPDQPTNSTESPQPALPPQSTQLPQSAQSSGTEQHAQSPSTSENHLAVPSPAVAHKPLNQRDDGNLVPPPPNSGRAVDPSSHQTRGEATGSNNDSPPAQSSRPPRQTPQPPEGSDNNAVTLKPPVQHDPWGEPDAPARLARYNALYRPSVANNDARLTILRDGPQGPKISGCVGASNFVMNRASESGHEPQADLYTASDDMTRMYFHGDTASHDSVENFVRTAQQSYQAGNLNIDLPNHERWGSALYYTQPGDSPQATRDRVIESLRQNFAVNREVNPSTGHTSPSVDMASVAFSSQTTSPSGRIGRIGHFISIQRQFTTDDYQRDRYIVYDNNYGAFRYDGFGQMTHALSTYWAGGAGPSESSRSMRSARVSYYGRQPDLSPQTTMNLAQLLNPDATGGAGPQVQAPPTIAPDPTLPPPLSGSMSAGRFLGDLKKRNAGDPAQPVGLYRPSTRSPDEVRQRQGFSLENTTLGHVNLGTHAGDLDSNSTIFDSAGYLGTFRDLSAATDRLSDEQGKATGYVYDVAPSPNMIDVDKSLGGQRNSGEFAAMGRLDWTQVRGWQEVKDGKPGIWQRNPDYRWDVYDRASTAGAQPQLAHYRADDPALGDPVFKPYVSSTTQDGKTQTALTQDPREAASQFYVHAQDRLKFMDSQTANRQNYRGAMQVVPDVARSPEGNAGGIYAYDPSDTSWAYSGPAIRDPKGESQFTYGPDGRFHSATEPTRVLRLNSNGNLFLGNLPDDPVSTNGVFEYTPDHRLRHVEDGKYLSRGGYDDGVIASSSANGSASEWSVTDDHRHPLGPFSAQKPPSYSGNILIDPIDDHEVNHLYVSKVAQPASMQAYVGDSGNDSNNTNVRRFVYGDDGRFHDANDANRTLGVDSQGNLKLGRRPDDPASLNGVFRYENGRLVHAEDNKYLSRGGNQSALYVSADDEGDYSKWAMEDGNGVRVTPPSVTLNDFNMLPPAAAHQLYRFDQDPDAALPAGTNRFVTQVPGATAPTTWDGNESRIADPGKAAAWLDKTHAAWLFQDGYYAVPAGADTLEIRRLDGATVGRLRTDKTTGKAQWTPEQPTPNSAFRVPDAIWDWVKRDEASVNGAAARPPAM